MKLSHQSCVRQLVTGRIVAPKKMELMVQYKARKLKIPLSCSLRVGLPQGYFVWDLYPVGVLRSFHE